MTANRPSSESLRGVYIHALSARDIRIVEARGSTPLYSTKQEKSELDSYRKRVRISSLLELYTKTNITLNVKESV